MITVEHLRIKEFRGIRDLELDLSSKTFAVWGPNGSGKSGVVDAIDFALTGKISRLSGSGSGGLTIARHAPHVHSRDKPADALVQLTVRSTANGKVATITRNVANPKTYTLDPELPEVRAAVERAASHPEIVLSRRDIIRFVAAEAGQRSKEVQALLKLDRLSQIRSTLKTVANRAATEHNSAQTQLESARNRLCQHLDLPQLHVESILERVNERRKTLELDQLSELTTTTRLDEGVTDSPVNPFNKASAIRELSAFLARFDDIGRDGLRSQNILLSAIGEARDSPAVFAAMRKRDFWEVGLGLLEPGSNECPFCDQEWSRQEDLVAHVREKVRKADAAKQLRDKVAAAAQSLRGEIDTLRTSVAAIRQLARASGNDEADGCLSIWSDSLSDRYSSLRSLDDVVSMDDALGDSRFLSVPENLADVLTSFMAAIEKVPDQSARVAATSFLSIAQERIDHSRQTSRSERVARQANLAARAIYNNYVDAHEEQLTRLYELVEAEFSAFYRKINSDDESSFRASLKPSAGKLDMEVDFYNLGMFPPLAYHSEGHQDGMGVCLYLALMKHLLGADFRLAVLDDVVMSVDSNHRKEFCNLLRDEFGSVQFIITTHEQYWAMQMMHAGLVNRKSQAHFFGWTVDAGPTVEQADFWDSIESALSRDDVSSAAATLRRNLEAIAGYLAASLGARVFYKQDGLYDFGDLISGVRERHKSLLGKAKKSAQSWSNADQVSRVEKLDEERKRIETELNMEAWAVNPAVHFNEWATMTSGEFRTVAAAYRSFLMQFKCDNSQCDGWISVIPNRQNPTVLRCPCQGLALNLETA